MKKVFFLVFCALICSASWALKSFAYEEKTVHRFVTPDRKLVCGSFEHPMRVAGYMNYPPFGWKEIFYRELDDVPYAVYYGMGVELFKRFATEYDLRYQFVNGLNDSELDYALQRGYVDILFGRYYDPNSYDAKKFFYPGYINNPLIIVTLKSDAKNIPENLDDVEKTQEVPNNENAEQTETPKDENVADIPTNGEITISGIPTFEETKVLETWEDLKGKKGAIRAEENVFDLLYPKIPSDVQIEKVEGAKRAFQLLLRKDIDFLIMSKFAYEAEVRRFKIRDYLSCSKKPLLSPVIFMTYLDGNPCAQFFKEEFEKKLKEYTDDENYIKSLLSAQIIAWENKFMNQKSLMYETDQEPETNEKKVEHNIDLEEWLKEQKKQLDRDALREGVKHKAIIF